MARTPFITTIANDPHKNTTVTAGNIVSVYALALARLHNPGPTLSLNETLNRLDGSVSS